MKKKTRKIIAWCVLILMVLSVFASLAIYTIM